MADLEVLALDPAVPQIRAPGTGDGYAVPRNMTMASGTTLSVQTVNAPTLTASSGVFTDASKNLTTTGTLAISQGGTGQTTANAAFNALAPSQATQSGKYLKTDGTNASWDALDISTADITGTLPVANGGTGITSGTSGGVPYFSASNTIASSAALAANALVIGGGAGVAPSTTTTGTGVVTALGTNVGSAGAFVVNGGALGTPSSGTVTNLTGTASININGTVGATTPNTGSFTSLTNSGNLTFSSTAQRITGDMSNATTTSRLMFQSSTTNGNTVVSAIPNGTGTTGGFDIFNNSDLTNPGRGRLFINASEMRVSSEILGTGTYLPMTFYTGGSERMRLDTSGNLGIGATPSYRLDVQGGTASFTGSSGANAIRVAGAGGSWFWIDNPTTTTMRFSSGATAGTGAMVLDSSGNVGIGTTSPVAGYRLNVVNDSGNSQQLIRAGTNFNSTIAFGDQDSSTSGQLIYAHNGDYMAFNTNAAERMRIDSSGNVGIGGTAQGNVRVHALGDFAVLGGNANSTAFGATGTVPTSITSTARGFYTSLTTAASFTLSNLYHFAASNVNVGAGATVTNQMGFIAQNGLTTATNNYGFYSDIASGSNRWNFYANGTAQNYFAGLTTIGTTNGDPVGNNVAGGALFADGRIQASVSSGTSVFVNRKTDDGTLVAFYQDGTQEGTISVSGNTVSYNAFAGSHWSQLQDNSKPDILRGTVMESINELCVWPDENNERLPKSKISDTAGSKKVYGVFMAWDNDWTATNDMLITSVGAFICRVNSSVTVQEGDLLESNGDGTARVQADDIIRSSTIGKVTSTVKTHQYADGSYCVPTVLYCG